MAKCEASTVIKTAKKYDGYLEKASNSKLDDFTANAGTNNYTMFGRDYDKLMGTKLNGQSWCAMYLCIMFVYAYGLKAAKKLLGGNLFSYTPTGYTKMGAKKKTPKAGDVVFFYNATLGRIAHVGLVTKVDSSKFYTIEGNTSSDAGVVRNGGSVNQKSYSLSLSTAYFATPSYSSVDVGTDNKVGTSSVKSTSSGRSNPYTVPTGTLKRGSSGSTVKWLQYELNQWKSTLKEDGDYGAKTEAQVKAYQKSHGLTADGVAGTKTIAKLKSDGV